MKFSHYPSPGGSLRNTLGSELKRKGIFQKNGRIKNLRGGVFGPQHKNAPLNTPAIKSPINVPTVESRQFVLQPVQPGIGGSGIATISADHMFNLMAHLPDPQIFMGYGSYVYAAYLVDQADNSFLAGVLRPSGSGVYQTQFHSPVPLVHYTKVIVSMENPMQLGPRPFGPIVLQVREPLSAVDFLYPLKAVGGGIWRKMSSLFRSRAKPDHPEGNTPGVHLPGEPTSPSTAEHPSSRQTLTGQLSTDQSSAGQFSAGQPPVVRPFGVQLPGAPSDEERER